MMMLGDGDHYLCIIAVQRLAQETFFITASCVVLVNIFATYALVISMLLFVRAYLHILPRQNGKEAQEHDNGKEGEGQ